MQQMEYQLKLLTPAFLGNAEQNGQWRTPPFKALLRQWWRIAVAKEHDYDYVKVREAEGRLFGHAWLENDKDEKGKNIASRVSKVRIRLDTWAEGNLQEWANDPTVFHKEVGANGRNIGAHFYLGYGPLTYNKDKKKAALKDDAAAIDAGQKNTLRLIWPNNEKTLSSIPQLIHWFGTIGGRSRNGWGSLDLNSDKDTDFTALDQNAPLLLSIARPLTQCLELEWPHAIGLSDDDKLLIWQTKEPRREWQGTMQDMARIKIEFRTQFRFNYGNNGPFQERHLLAYPVTNHNVNELDKSQRLANQLRFKVTQTSNGQYRGIAYHLPCRMPDTLVNKLRDDKWQDTKCQKQVWEKVHAVLDEQMKRI